MRQTLGSGEPCWGGSPPRPYSAELGDGSEFDVVIVGAGLAGCSAALHLADERRELSIALVDAGGPGAGGSGRGTGLLGPRLGPPIDIARRRYGDAVARSLYRRSVRAVGLVLRLAAQHAPEAVTPCDGQIVVGVSRPERADVLRRAYAYRDVGLDVGLIVAGERARPAAAAELALHYPLAAGVDPAALTVGLARAAAARGVLIGENRTVLRLQPAPRGRTTVRTSRGDLHARAVIVCTDGGLAGIAGCPDGLLRLEVCAQATEPLPDDLLKELGGPQGAQVLAADRLGAYRRITPEGRLVIGGGPATALPASRPHLERQRRRAWSWQQEWLERVHPALGQVSVSHRWSGSISLTRDGLPILGRLHCPGEIWYASGWNGHGLASTVLAGQHLAESVLTEEQVARTASRDVLWRPARPWWLARPAARVVVRAGLRLAAPTATLARSPRSPAPTPTAGRAAAECPVS